MTDFAGFPVPGVGLGPRTAYHHAVVKAGVVSCPLHEDGVVTSRGTRYNCDEGHLLLAPQEPGERDQPDES